MSWPEEFDHRNSRDADQRRTGDHFGNGNLQTKEPIGPTGLAGFGGEFAGLFLHPLNAGNLPLHVYAHRRGSVLARAPLLFRLLCRSG